MLTLLLLALAASQPPPAAADEVRSPARAPAPVRCCALLKCERSLACTQLCQLTSRAPPSPCCRPQAHTYLSLWGPLFAGRSRDSALNSTAPSAWLEEFHARLVALLNASHLPPLFGGGGDRAPFEGRLLPDWGPGAEGAGGLLNQLRELTPTLQRGALPSLIRHGPLGAARGLPSSSLEVPGQPACF